MAKFEYSTKYDIGEVVYSIEGDKGKVVNISHTAAYGVITYNVIFRRKPADDIWVTSKEISRQKVIE